MAITETFEQVLGDQLLEVLGNSRLAEAGDMGQLGHTALNHAALRHEPRPYGVGQGLELAE